LRIAKPDDILKVRDIFSLLAFWKRARDQKEVNSMNKYELAVVVSAMIEDDARTAVVDKCKALVERFGGKIADVEEWGKKKLAYEIQKMTEGYYYFIHFESDGTAISEIDSRIRIMDGVIRYLCIRQDEA
jgi:small subunit ribosomal protein S6